jgi:hypothetical protein
MKQKTKDRLKTAKNFITKYNNWLNRMNDKECRHNRDQMARRNWALEHKRGLYVITHTSAWGILLSVGFMFVMSSIFYEKSLWVAPLIICTLVTVLTALYINHEYKNRG